MNSLIYGKDLTDRVVSIEPDGATATVFRELADGTVVSSEVPNSHYILFTEQHSPKMKRLDGNQPYRWLYETDSREKYQEVLSASYKKRYDLHVIRDAKEALMVKDGLTYFKGMKVEDVSVLSFDLEHTYGIGSEMNPNGTLLLISTTFRKKGEITRRLFALDDCEGDESAMLTSFCGYVRKMNPSIVLGHNILGHDFPVLRFAANKSGNQLRLGRDNSPAKFADRTSQFRKDGSQSYDYHNVLIYGREVVDTYFLAIKTDVARNYESYGLKQIIKQEGLERTGRQHYDASKIGRDWSDLEKRKQIKAYAIDDADDALKLYDLMIPSLFYYTQSIPRSLQQIVNTATGSQINSAMVRGYLQQGHSIAKGSDAVEFEGAISFGIPGIHKNVMRVDVASLYPSVMRQYKIYCKDKDPQALFLKVVEYFTIERLNNKKLGKETGERYYKDIEQSQKIAINSMYGFLGAPKLNYNFPKGASEVTRYGRQILQRAILWASGKEYRPAEQE
jgi:DNA polymerase, archaea type